MYRLISPHCLIRKKVETLDRLACIFMCPLIKYSFGTSSIISDQASMYTCSLVSVVCSRQFSVKQLKFDIYRGGTSFVDHLCYFCLMFVMLSRLRPCSHLLGRLSFVMLNCAFVTFPCGILGQVMVLYCIDS